MNGHDRWLGYRGAIVSKIGDLGIPADILKSEQAFAAFLTLGHISGVAFEMDKLSPEQCRRLFDVVTSYFDSGAEAFTALECRRLAGFRKVSES